MVGKFWWPSLRGMLFSVLFAGLFGGAVFDSSALADTPCGSQAFHVRGIKAQAEAKTGDLARELATAAAYKKAWAALVERLVIADRDLSPLDEVDAGALVVFTHIASETVLSHRYIAVLDVCFDREATRRIFQEKGFAHAELASGRMSIFPVFVSSGTAHLWQEPNPWKKTLEKMLAHHNGLVALSIPHGLGIERSVTASAVATGDAATIEAAARLDKATMVIASIAQVSPLKGKFELVVSATLFDWRGDMVSHIGGESVLMDSIEELPEQLERLGQRLINRIEYVWRQANQLHLTHDRTLRLMVAVTSPADWIETLAMLERLPPVESYQVRRIAANGGILDLTLIGSRDALGSVLARAGYRLERNDDDQIGGFVLKPAP